jgi:hypothetical protein
MPRLRSVDARDLRCRSSRPHRKPLNGKPNQPAAMPVEKYRQPRHASTKVRGQLVGSDHALGTVVTFWGLNATLSAVCDIVVALSLRDVR